MGGHIKASVFNDGLCRTRILLIIIIVMNVE